MWIVALRKELWPRTPVWNGKRRLIVTPYEVLVKGDDRFQALAILRTMDSSLEVVTFQYGKLRKYMRGDRSACQSSSCIHLLLECASAANAAVESVNRAQNELALDHPHISSSYHVLALVFLIDFVVEINTLIIKSKLERNPHMALQFVAEVVELPFHSCEFNKLSLIVKRFVKKSGLDKEINHSYHNKVYESFVKTPCTTKFLFRLSEILLCKHALYSQF
jgi:hypothetical protein